MDGSIQSKRNRYEAEDEEGDAVLAKYHEDAGFFGGIDMPFFILTLIILTVGVIMVLSASFATAYIEDGNPTEYFTRQAIFAVMGVAVMLIASRMTVAFYRKMAMPVLAVSIILLALVPFIGVERGGATRWIDLGITTFQPSELAKPAVVLAFAAMICNIKNQMKTFKYGVVPFGVILAVIVGLLFLEPHLSASIIIIAVGAIMMFIGGTDLKWFLVGGGTVLGVGIIYLLLNDYAMSRVLTWLDPFRDPQGDGFQTIQSLYAIGSGGLLGLGLGQGRQKYLYLPEEHNDFIFSVYCEELGYIGAILILILFAMLIMRGFWIAMNARTKFGLLIAVGITSILAIQVFFNVAVVTNLLPCTGISLPFFSYGGTALVVQLGEMGIVLAVSREIPLKKRKKRQSSRVAQQEQ